MVKCQQLVYILANGVASNGFMIDEENTKVFKRGLTDFAMDLAKLVIKDGEGTIRFVTVTVKASLISSSPAFHVSDHWYSPPSYYQDAHNVASRISTSALVKTALCGEDAK